MNGTGQILILVDALLTALLSFVVGIGLFLVKRYSDRQGQRDQTLQNLSGDMRSLREGMSVGAREAVGHLAGRLDTLEDGYDQLSDKVVELRTQWRILDRTVEGHIGTPRTHAHPPGMGPPVPA